MERVSLKKWIFAVLVFIFAYCFHSFVYAGDIAVSDMESNNITEYAGCYEDNADPDSIIHSKEYRDLAHVFYNMEHKDDIKSNSETVVSSSDMEIKENTTNTCTVHFDSGDSYDEYEDQVVNLGDHIVRPSPDPTLEGCQFYGWFTAVMDENWDPDQEDAYVKMWDFDTDTVTEAGSLYLYAYFLPVDMFSEAFVLTSSTGKTGYWTDTVIGQGCTIKLFPADKSGVKLKLPKGSIEWLIAPVLNDVSWSDMFLKNDQNLQNYFTFKNGTIKCKKNTPVGYKVAVKAKYNNNSAYYIMTVMPKVKKFGYIDKGKIKTNVVVELETGSNCDFGYGGLHFIGQNNYPRYYSNSNSSIGVGVYEQPDGSRWVWGNFEGLSSVEFKNRAIQQCSAILPKNIQVTTRYVSKYGGSTALLYYFKANKAGTYKVSYVAPDGSGKKFVVKFKVKKPKKSKNGTTFF